MKNENRLIIVSGLSGSGKSVALHALEDLGYYCIDNLPAALLSSLIDEVTQSADSAISRIAVGIDARSPKEKISTLPNEIADVRESGIQTDLLFLQANDNVLLKRFGETRRRHPLTTGDSDLRAAIKHERDLLGPIINASDLVIDTTRLSVYELADAIRERVDRRTSRALSILLQSFGFKHGIPTDADFVFDLRCLPNPYWQPELRSLTGLDAPVSEFLDAEETYIKMYEHILEFLHSWIPEYVKVKRSYLTVALGCTGGQHRSVYMTKKLAAALSKTHDSIHTRHNELGNL